MPALIYQIGRLDRNITSTIRFKIGNENIVSELSSIALKKYFENKKIESKVHLFYPVSLVVNPIFQNYNENDNFFSEIKRINSSEEALEALNEYLKNPYEIYRKHPHTKYSTFSVLPSFGKFKHINNNIEFKSSMDDLVLFLFLSFVKDYMDNNFNDELEIYVDVSTGHNPYIAALLEAVRSFYVFAKLFYIYKPDFSPKINLMYTDPILGNDNAGEYNLYFDYKLKYKTVFMSPLNREEIANNSYRSVYVYRDEYKDKIKDYRYKLIKTITNYALTFSAIKNYTPLVLYYIDRDEIDNIVEIFEGIIDIYNKEFGENIFNTSGRNFKKDIVIKTFLSLSFYCGLLKLTSFIENRTDWIDLEKLEESFVGNEGVYAKIGLSESIILKNEIHNIKEIVERNNEKREGYYFEFYKREERENINDKTPINSRNFLAHAGFANTLVKIKKEGNKIFLKYDVEKIDNRNQRMLEIIKKFMAEYI